jgi:hypothetical protein
MPSLFSTGTALHIRIRLRDICCAALPVLLLLCPEIQAKAIDPPGPPTADQLSSPVAAGLTTGPGSPDLVEGASSIVKPAAANGLSKASRQLIVIGFMGGSVRASNLVHREALMAKDLQQRYPRALHAAVFANRDGDAALKSVLQLLDRDRNGSLSAEEKSAARIVIYGHSWGASETVTLARRLNKLSIPVLLTIQVDSVQKSNEHDGRIPPNVREAINFYQLDGLLHGRSVIQAMDPAKTDILGNFESTYKRNPVSCAGYPWFARAFMKPHIEIENDPLVWNKIEALIQSEVVLPGGAR